MISHAVRVTYYALLSPIMRLNAAKHRLFDAPASSTRAQLGPGRNNYLPGWVNVDANLVSSHPDIWSDLRYKLPFRDSSLVAIYSHHVIEHLPNLDFHFHEMFRCLRPGGVIRVGGPNGDNAIIAMQRNNLRWFGDWPTKRRSIGGRFENFIFCKGEHLTILTESFLRELAEDAGFIDLKVVSPKSTNYPDSFDGAVFDNEPLSSAELPNTLLIEARRPR